MHEISLNFGKNLADKHYVSIIIPCCNEEKFRHVP